MTEKIFNEIKEERKQQDAKWGVQDHNNFVWNTILGEEKGEVDKASLDIEDGLDTQEHLREELIQVAAVAIAYIECIDRRKK